MRVKFQGKNYQLIITDHARERMESREVLEESVVEDLFHRASGAAKIGESTLTHRSNFGISALVPTRVGDEILGDGLTAAEHPMYSLDTRYIPPYEPNPESAAYIPRPGRISGHGKSKRFRPLYFAGGFQGGRTEPWIAAMKTMKELIDKDFVKNYIPIWNDESVWNRYCFDNPPGIVLNPSYVYPDSLNSAYYRKIWGRNYVPKIITITKPFTLSKEGGDYVQKLTS